MAADETQGSGFHNRIYPYMTEVRQYANEQLTGPPWIVRDRSTALRNERRGHGGRALVRAWSPGPWVPITSGNHAPWSPDLPGWVSAPDPHVLGSLVWYYVDHHGEPDIALAMEVDPGEGIVVFGLPVINETEVDGEYLGNFPSWDEALQFAVTHLEEM